MPPSVSAVCADDAAHVFRHCEGMDPEGIATPRLMADVGRCFRVDAQGGAVYLSYGLRDGALWCYAAASEGGHGLADVALKATEDIARMTGCRAAMFQTLRRGLVRRAQRQGWHCVRPIGTGWIMEKQV